MQEANSNQSAPLLPPRTVQQVPDNREQSRPGDPSLPSSTMSSGKPLTLSDFFIIGEEPRTLYSDWEIRKISQLLVDSDRHAWSQVPRLYIILREIKQLKCLDAIIDQGYTDVWFPFNQSSVPRNLHSSCQERFLEAQHLVLTKVVSMENDGLKQHAHFGRNELFPYEVRGKLGSGGYGTVDRIYSTLSQREYARKLFRRDKGRANGKEIMSFKNELQMLKKIDHRHCVELVASYTDTKYFGLLMSPVADCDLATFYDRTTLEPETLPLLRGFHGCLITALSYLHEEKIRHRDIKPENILVKGRTVYLTDFGVSLNWGNLSRSTTVDDHGKSLAYCAPEVARYERRNKSSDIWSLGCVFFEMGTVLHGGNIESMRQSFKETSETYHFYQNLDAAREWSQSLMEKVPKSDNASFEWALSMMNINAEARPSASEMCEKILSTNHGNGAGTSPFALECCAPSAESESSDDDEHATEDELWAQDHDDQLNSPPSTDSSSKALEEKKENESTHAAVDHDAVNEDTVLQTDQPPSNPSTSSSTSSESSLEDEGEQLTVPANFDTENTLVPDGRPAAAVELVDTEQSIEPLPKMEECFSDLDFPPPSLTPESWGSPWALLEAIQSDRTFVENLTSRDLFYLRFVEEATIKDVYRLLKALVENGLRVDDRDHVTKEGNTPLMMVATWNSDFSCVFKLLVDHGADVRTRTGGGPLCTACAIGNLFAINLILDKGVDVNRSTDKKKESGDKLPLSIAVSNHEFEAVKLLLSRGANPDGKSGNPLLLACKAGNVNIVEALLDKGANISKYTTNYKDWGDSQPVMVATESNQLEVLKLLLKRGAQSDAKSSDGATPLICACANDRLPIVEFLFEKYPNRLDMYTHWNVEMTNGWRRDATALDIACMAGHYRIVEYLLEHGVDPNRGRDFMIGNFSALHFAAMSGEVEIVKLLLTHGADITARTVPMFTGRMVGSTALSFARNRGHKEVIKVLLAAAEESGWLAMAQTTIS